MFFRRKAHFKHRWRRRGLPSHHGVARHPCTLADSPPGCPLRVIGFMEGISLEQRERLYAYGLIPGNKVSVLQHSPVTIVNVEHTELALERDLARLVQVEAV